MNIDWKKMNNEVPVIIQNAKTLQVLMLGYMNPEALEKTMQTKQVTFYSRSKQRLWTKGETSANTLTLADISMDCDSDALLIKAIPNGPTCHNNTPSCFNNQRDSDWQFLLELERLIEKRKIARPDNSYTTELFNAGIERMAQKVGEEGVEVALAAVAQSNEKLTEEAADLLFHLLVLLKEKNLGLGVVITQLMSRRGIALTY